LSDYSKDGAAKLNFSETEVKMVLGVGCFGP